MDSMNASRGLRPVQSLAKWMCHDGRWKRVALDPPAPPSSPEVRLLRYESPCFLIYSFFFYNVCRYERCAWTEQTGLVRRDY